MVITCNNCQKQYKIDPEKITEKGAKITCPACGHSFIVKRKAEKKKKKPEKEDSKVKTPPCVVCGNPSTRVLQGDPPMTLCEHCFDTEQEKRRRFTAFEPPSDATAPAGGPAQEATDPNRTFVVPQTPGQTPQAPPAPAPASPQSDEYESFDEMPVFTDGETLQQPPDQKEESFIAPAHEQIQDSFQPEESPHDQEEESFVAPAHEQMQDPFQPDASPPEEDASPPGPEPAPPEPETPQPEPETPSTEREPAGPGFEPDAFRPEAEAFQPEPETPSPEREPETPSPEVDAFRPETERGPAFYEPETFTPEPEISSSIGPDAFQPEESSFEREVEQSFLREEKDITAPLGMTAPSPRAYQAESHVPAYLISAGILVIALLGLVYYFFSQDYFSYFKSQTTTHGPRVVPEVELVEPPIETAEADPEQEAIHREALAKRLSEHISTARRLFLLDTTAGYQKAIAEMESALNIAPDLAEAQAFIMESYAFYSSLKDNAFFNRRAEKMLGKASPGVVLRPEYDRTRAHVFINQGQGKAAREILERSLEANPDDAVAYYLLGKTYLLDSPPSMHAAQVSFENAISLAPEMTRAYWERAQILREQGQNEQARQTYRLVLKHSPNKSDAEDALAELEGVPDAEAKPIEAPAETSPTEEQPEVSMAPTVGEPPGEAVPEEAGAPAPAPVPVPAPDSAPAVETAPEEPEDLTPIKLETIEGISKPAGESKKAPKLVGLETSEDQISNSLIEVISVIDEPLSRVRMKTRPRPAVTPQPTTPVTGAPYPDRPPEEAP